MTAFFMNKDCLLHDVLLTYVIYENIYLGVKYEKNQPREVLLFVSTLNCRQEDKF